ncbi:MAG: cytochrome c oxidase assembly protein [Rhizobiales bacterium]|nr:cytochrome c oxidase assembly protein [Hyphomicrobiales bacterium]
MSEANRPAPRRSRMGLTAAACAVFVVAMIGAAFAVSPLYSMFCSLTGFGGATRQAEKAPGEVLDREITILFDSNISNDLGWSFRPEQRQMKVKLGEVAEAAFLAENRSDHTTTGLAAFNVMPGEIGVYFNKIACFCFNQQTLKPGEKARWTVQFFVDPAIAKDPEQNNLDAITLSYTFFPAANPDKPVAAAEPATPKRPL